MSRTPQIRLPLRSRTPQVGGRRTPDNLVHIYTEGRSHGALHDIHPVR
ncbi:MAG: hypothetical protein H5U24_06025 [Thioclava marina]|nr:hypothetical protein [Thioclava marina]MBC7144949.1 hypothetical protein [Thioclava marina]